MMLDITKCKGIGCKRKKNCYRYTAKEEMLQSYFVDIPKEPCEYYWANDESIKY